jgi:hypothetical protein
VKIDHPMLEAVRDRYARIDALEARHRWFEQFDAEKCAKVSAERPGRLIAASGRESEETVPLRAVRSPDPLVVLDRLESLVSEAIDRTPDVRESEAVKVDGRRELDQLVATLEAAVDRPSFSESPRRETRHSILFSDLRRRRDALRRGETKRT